MKKLLAFILLFVPLLVHAQQPQAPNTSPIAPLFDVNAKYANGVAPGYWATAGAGLTLNVSAGTAFCPTTKTTYAGGTLSMTDNTTNYIYLNTGSSCVPATSTSSSVFTTNVPIAEVVTLSGAITTITDDRTMFGGAAASGGGVVANCSAQYSFAEYLTAGTSVGCGPTPPAVNGTYLCEYSVTASVAVPPTCPQLGLAPRSVTGASDTILYSDVGLPVVYSGTAAVAVTLPTPTSLGNTGFWFVIDNFTSGPGGNVTVTPTTFTVSTDSGSTGSTLVVSANQECRIEVDPAHTTTNWLAHCSATLSSLNTRRTCDIAIGDTSGSAITNGALGPQKRLCYIPAAATVIEMDVAADAGTPNIIIAVDHAGSNSNIVSSALGTAGSGGIACSNTGGTTGIDGATTCSGTLQNTSMVAGDYLEAVSGTAGGQLNYLQFI